MAVRTLLDKIITDAEPAGETRGPRAFALPALRPYLPDRHFLRRTGTGVGVLAATTWRGARAGIHRIVGAPTKKPTSKDELADAAERFGFALLILAIGAACLAGVLKVVGPRLLPYLPVATGAGVLGLLVAAYALGPAEAPGSTGTKAHVVPDGDSTEPAPVSPGEVARAVRQIAAPHGWLGAHIAAVAERLQADRGVILDALAEAGIAVTDQLKLTLPGGRQSNRQGVRLDALPAGLGEAPEPAPEHPAEGAPEVPAQPLPAPLTVHPQSAG